MNDPNIQSPYGKITTAQPLNKLSIASIGLLVLILVAMVAGGTVLMQKNKKIEEQNTQITQKLEQRIASLEAADNFAEKQINKDKNQGVFLTSGQVYFGKITEMTKDTIKLEKIYYLKNGNVDKNGNSTSGNDVSLVKLGAELHSPEDVMVIERKNVSFWENLENDGQVAKAIDEHQKSNPAAR